MNKIIKKYRFFTLILILIFLNGCISTATTTPMSAQNKQAVHTVRIDKNIKTAKKIYYFGPGIVYLGLLGMMGGILMAIKTEHETSYMQEFAASNNIYIDQIVKNQFIEQIKSNTNLKFVEKGQADAVLIIEVLKYGLTVPQAFSWKLKPILMIDAKLVRGNQLLWKSGYRIYPYTKMPKYKEYDIKHNPVVLYEAWDFAAKVSVQHMLSTL